MRLGTGVQISWALLLMLVYCQIVRSASAQIRLSHPNADCLALSDTGKLLATSGPDGIRVWNVGQRSVELRKGAHLFRSETGFSTARAGITSLTFYGERILASSGRDGNVVFWDVSTGRQKVALGNLLVYGSGKSISTLRRVPVRHIALDSRSDNCYAAIHNAIYRWDMQTGDIFSITKELTSKRIDIEALVGGTKPSWNESAVQEMLAIPPKGDMQKIEALNFCHLSGLPFTSIAILPETNRLVAQSAHRVSVLNIESGKLIRDIEGPTSFAVSRDGSRMVLGRPRTACEIWRIDTLEPIEQSIVRGVPQTYLNDGLLLLTRSGTELVVWDGESRQQCEVFGKSGISVAGRLGVTTSSKDGSQFACIRKGLTRNNVFVFGTKSFVPGESD